MDGIPATEAGTLGQRFRRRLKRLVAFWIVIALLSTVASCVRIGAQEAGKPRAWRGGGGTDLRSSAGLAPAPDVYSGAVVQAYAARTWGAKKVMAVHTWIATKRPGAAAYTTYQVIGWRMRGGRSSVVVEAGVPDRPWYGNTPQLLTDRRGEGVDQLIDRIEALVADYPFAFEYTTWPGPNSNTFVAYLGRHLPELGLDLPSTAIGKDFLGDDWLSVSTAGDGWQWSARGLLGLALGPDVGLEVNLLGLNLEIDMDRPALELPGYGRLGSAPCCTMSTEPGADP